MLGKVCFSAALALLGSMSAAHAADLGGTGPNEHRRIGVYGVPSEPMIIYDTEPGTYVRAYFLPPWRGRHYFPASGEAPRYGRDENLNADYEMPEKAESYYRSWSNADAYVRRVRQLPPPKSFDPETQSPGGDVPGITLPQK